MNTLSFSAIITLLYLALKELDWSVGRPKNSLTIEIILRTEDAEEKIQ
jgi:hypothetical protein